MASWRLFDRGMGYHLGLRSEQAANRDSRVVLIAKRDRLNVPRVGLDWRLTEQDTASIERGWTLLAQEFGRLGLGRIRLPDELVDRPWREYLVGGAHHMGTTRMAVDSKQGVVDPNSRVHGMANLFVAGSSVFPTSGYANPTLTIVALAIRLADHLKGLLS